MLHVSIFEGELLMYKAGNQTGKGLVLQFGRSKPDPGTEKVWTTKKDDDTHLINMKTINVDNWYQLKTQRI